MSLFITSRHQDISLCLLFFSVRKDGRYCNTAETCHEYSEYYERRANQPKGIHIYSFITIFGTIWVVIIRFIYSVDHNTALTSKLIRINSLFL